MHKKTYFYRKIVSNQKKKQRTKRTHEQRNDLIINMEKLNPQLKF